MLVYILLFIFLLSFIPSFRETVKKGLKGLYIVIGIGFLIVTLIMDFFTYPKLVTLYKSSNIPLDYTRLTSYLVIGTILSIAILLIGLKFNKLSKNNLIFYLLFGFLIAAIALIVQLTIISIIMPIYQITSSTYTI